MSLTGTGSSTGSVTGNFTVTRMISIVGICAIEAGTETLETLTGSGSDTVTGTRADTGSEIATETGVDSDSVTVTRTGASSVYDYD